MANELQFYGDTSLFPGKTVVGKVYDASGTQVGSDITMTEVGSTGIFRGDMPTAAKGSYGVRFIFNDIIAAQGEIFWDGNNEVTILDGGGGGISKQDLDNAVAEIATDINNIPVSQIGSKSKND